MAIDLFLSDCSEVLKSKSSASVDSLITDPPAGISFMGKSWDGDKGGRDEWIKWMESIMRECFRVMKPGAHGLVWALPRTSHWTATALENAGFEVRDVVTHLFGSGFPKSHDILKAIDKAAGATREVVGIKRKAQMSDFGVINDDGWELKPLMDTAPSTDSAKQWQGWGTALKPASEHWILIRKPCSEKTVAANVLKHGCGGINIDASRIEGEYSNQGGGSFATGKFANSNRSNTEKDGVEFIHGTKTQGRFPANLVLTEGEATEMLDEQSGMKCGAAAPVRKKKTPDSTNLENYKPHTSVGDDGKSFKGDSGGASRFFYCAKISSSERGEGNTHPTVKPKKLMSYLIRMITPPGGIVLDPFMGSGSTGIAAKECGFDFIGIEKEQDYFEIAKARINGK